MVYLHNYYILRLIHDTNLHLCKLRNVTVSMWVEQQKHIVLVCAKIFVEVSGGMPN